MQSTIGVDPFHLSIAVNSLTITDNLFINRQKSNEKIASSSNFAIDAFEMQFSFEFIKLQYLIHRTDQILH